MGPRHSECLPNELMRGYHICLFDCQLLEGGAITWSSWYFSWYFTEPRDLRQVLGNLSGLQFLHQ